MAQYGAFRFGWDSPTRIATSTTMLLESSEQLPEQTLHQSLVPFPSNSSIALNSGGVSSSSSSAIDQPEWRSYPGRLDLFCYQGDDVQIPLFFQDPSDWEIDMSTVAGWEWLAQIRVFHSARSTLVNEFIVAAEYLPGADEEPGSQTQVTLFLPRDLNVYTGCFSWDVRSLGPFVGPDYPEPPTDLLKTWLYGTFIVVPRVSATEFVPPTTALPVGGGNAVAVAMTSAGWCVGPNGRVP